MTRSLLFSLIALALCSSVNQLTCADGQKKEAKCSVFAELPVAHIQQEAQRDQTALLRSKKKTKRAR